MPTIHQERGLSFRFYSNEGNEPAHIHVDKGGGEAKFWLEPDVRLAYNYRLSRRDLATAQAIIERERATFLRRWYGHR
jgi:hypothetical protein